MKAMGRPPIFAASREAPMTATEAGLKQGAGEARSIAPRSSLKASARVDAVTREIVQCRHALELRLQTARDEQAQHVEIAHQRQMRVDQRRGPVALEHEMRGHRDAITR